MRTPKQGFTLVKLLVVIAIITILAGLLLPALGKAVESARRIACANRLKQTGFVLRFYADDHEGFVPIGYEGRYQSNYWVATNAASLMIFGEPVEFGYLEDPLIYYCGSEKGSYYSYNGSDNLWDPGGGKVRSSWGVRPRALQGGTLHRYEWFSGTLNGSGVKATYRHLEGKAITADLFNVKTCVDQRHEDGINANYADGGVSWVRREAFEVDLELCGSVSNDKNDEQLRIWRALDRER